MQFTIATFSVLFDRRNSNVDYIFIRIEVE